MSEQSSSSSLSSSSVSSNIFRILISPERILLSFCSEKWVFAFLVAFLGEGALCTYNVSVHQLNDSILYIHAYIYMCTAYQSVYGLLFVLHIIQVHAYTGKYTFCMYSPKAFLLHVSLPSVSWSSLFDTSHCQQHPCNNIATKKWCLDIVNKCI